MADDEEGAPEAKKWTGQYNKDLGAQISKAPAA
jgi:hypothetical protein